MLEQETIKAQAEYYESLSELRLRINEMLDVAQTNAERLAIQLQSASRLLSEIIEHNGQN